MIEIRALTSFDPACFAEIASGYASLERYAVKREVAGESIIFHIELEALDQPFVKRWDDDSLYAHYAKVIHEGLSLGAFDGDRLVAVAIAERRAWNGSLWVCEFHVHPDMRGEHIGRRLMESLIDKARGAGLGIIVCETQNINVPAIRFYRSVGFELDGIDLSYYGDLNEVAFFMKRKV